MVGLCRGVVFPPFVRLGVNYQSHGPVQDASANVNCLPLMREKADKQKGFTAAHPSPPLSRTQETDAPWRGWGQGASPWFEDDLYFVNLISSVVLSAR